MTTLTHLRHALFVPMDDRDAWLPTLARLVFLAVFLVYYLNSAGTKIEGGLFSPSAGAFAQVFPRAAEAVLYDVSQLTLLQRVVLFLGTVGEYVLPVLIVAGFLTRLAALGMIGFIVVQTAVDVTGHGVALGAWFNNAPELIDERTLWVFLMVVLVIKGAGPFSVDRMLRPAG